MKSLSVILYLLLTFQLLSAQEPIEQKKLTETEKKEELIQQLFSTREKKQFEQATLEANKLAINKQILLEATFLYHIDRSEYDEIITLTEQFTQMADQFDPNISKIFSNKEDWLSVTEYGHALKALKEKNIPLFKKHIQEAFWLSPNKAAAFAPHINKLHTRAAMEKIKLNLDQKIFQINQPKTTSIAKMLEGKEALVLRFWTPWSQQAEINLPTTIHLAKLCSQNKVSFASILISKEPQAIKDSLEVIDLIAKELPSYWLADENNSTLTKLLRVNDLPTIIVISKEGKIIYNGTLDDKELWQSLSKINPNIKEK